MKKLLLLATVLFGVAFSVNAQVGNPCTDRDENGNWYSGTQHVQSSSTTTTTTTTNSSNNSYGSSATGSTNASLTNPGISASQSTSQSRGSGNSTTTTTTTTTNTICVPNDVSRKQSGEDIVNGLRR